jgi:hypothetical protein
MRLPALYQHGSGPAGRQELRSSKFEMKKRITLGFRYWDLGFLGLYPDSDYGIVTTAGMCSWGVYGEKGPHRR